MMQVGRLWTSLADFFIRQALFEKARDVYEEGLTTVSFSAPLLPACKPGCSRGSAMLRGKVSRQA